MKSIDKFLDRMPSDNYTCLDFAREVWLFLTGEDAIARIMDQAKAASLKSLKAESLTPAQLRSFTVLQHPENPCIVFMHRDKTIPHVGIFLNGRILHLTTNGVEFQPLLVARRHMRVIRFYK